MLSQRLLIAVGRVSQQSLRNFSNTKPALATFTVQDETEFKMKILDSPKPILVNFSAPWVGPCKLLNPRLAAAIATTEGNVDHAIVDMDDLPLSMLDIVIKHGVIAVPTNW